MYLTHPDSASAIGASIATSGHVIKSVVLSIHGGLVQSCCYQRISSLEEVVVPDGVTEIGCAAFESCCSLRGCALEMFHPPAVEMELGPWAFESCKNLRSVTLPIGGSKISTCAFRGCDCITNLTVPCSSRAYVDQNDVEYSDPNRQSGTLFGLGCVRVLFLGNLSIWSALGTRELSELTVGEGVEKISSQFKGLNNLKTLKLPTSLKDVGDEAFAGLVGLQSFELPDSIESIGRNVFDGIPQGFVHRHDGVEYVGACAVGVDADDVERVVIEPGTCLISNAFHNCAQLREVVLPNSIRCFGTDAFSGCVSLESFVVPKGCKVIGGNAFGGCTILKNVYVPSSVERIGSSFCGCSPSLTFEVESVGRWASANYYAHYTGAYALTCRGDEVCDVTVAARNEYASRWSFKNCSSLRRASLDASVKELPKQAFYACASLAELTLTKGLRAVRQDACQGCKMLSSLSLPDGVEVIETWAFRDCPNIEDVRIPSSVVQVGWNVFHLYHSSARSDNDCSRCAPRILRLGSVNCFKFFDVRQVEEFELIEGAYQFGDGHFACKPEQYSKFEGFLHNKSLKKVVLPQSLRVLESYSFYDCPNLKSLKLPEGLVVMGDCIVEDYRKIEGGHPPRALACLGMFSRFGYGTEPADSLEIEDGLVYWGQWLVDEVDPMIKELKPREGTIGVRHGVKVLENLRYVVLPSSVKWIAPFAFGGCEKLERVDLPEGLEFIGDMAFSGCKLMREISLPFGLRIIGESVFSGCDMLREIHIPERVEYMHFDAFGFRDKGVSPRKIYIEGDPKLVSGFLPANKDRRDLLLPLLIERKEGPLLEREKYFANGSAYEEYYVTSKWSGVVDDGAEHRNYHIWQNNQSGPGTVTPSFQGDGVDDFQGELPF